MSYIVVLYRPKGAEQRQVLSHHPTNASDYLKKIQELRQGGSLDVLIVDVSEEKRKEVSDTLRKYLDLNSDIEGVESLLQKEVQQYNKAHKKKR